MKMNGDKLILVGFGASLTCLSCHPVNFFSLCYVGNSFFEIYNRIVG